MNIKHFSLEGIDGCGKSTQLRLLREEIEKCKFRVAALCSPSTSPLGEFIRENVRQLEPWVRTELFLLDIRCSIQQASGNGADILLWDRYVDSFYASNPEMTEEEAELITANLPKPTKTFFLDIEPRYVFSERAQVVDHHCDPKWMAMKATRYQALLTRYPERMVRIDARQEQGVITNQILQHILAACP